MQTHQRFRDNIEYLKQWLKLFEHTENEAIGRCGEELEKYFINFILK